MKQARTQAHRGEICDPDFAAAVLAAERARAEDRAALVAGTLTAYAVSEYLIRHCGSYRRLPEVMAFKGVMAPIEWWRLLGKEWSGFDNVATYAEELRSYLRRANRDHLNAMMTRYERQKLRALSGGELTVYRGCYPMNREGLSWSLSEPVARQFPTLSRYRREGQVPLILVAKADPARVVVKTGRGQQEVICTDVRLISEADL